MGLSRNGEVWRGRWWDRGRLYSFYGGDCTQYRLRIGRRHFYCSEQGGATDIAELVIRLEAFAAGNAEGFISEGWFFSLRWLGG